MKSENKYFDDTGHLNTEGRATYVDAVEGDDMNSIPELNRHVNNCVKCTTEVEELFKLSQETSNVKTTSENITSSEKETSLFSYYKIAAVITLPLIIGISLWWIAGRHSDESLFNKHFEVYEATESRSSENITKSAFTEALSFYNNGDYESAIASFKQTDLNMYARFYLANCYLRVNQPNEAINHLQYIAKEFDHFKDVSRWYLALAHLKKGDITSSKAFLVQLANDKYADNFYRNKAQQLLNELESIWR